MNIHFQITFFLFFFSFFLLQKWRKSRNHLKLPPGPWKLPIFGNLHQLIGSLPHHALKNLSQKHGPLMHVKLGELQAVVVSSPRIAKEIAKTNDVAFCDRVELTLTKIVLYNSTGIASTSYGEYWRQMRKLWVLEFLCPKKVRSFRGLMEDEVSRMVDFIRSRDHRGGRELINLTQMILALEYKIICKVTVGRVWEDQDQESLIQVIKEAVSIAGVFNFAEVFPSMRLLHFLSAGSTRRLKNMHRKVDHILEDIIRKHEEKRVSGNDEVEDIVDVFLRASERKDLQVPITRDNIKANILEMFIAGIETSSLVIEWAMSEMMKNPRALHKAQVEVRQILQDKQTFQENDIQNLSYLKMVIKETLRTHPPGPLLCPRRCRQQSTVDGYDIPVGTIVMINVWAIGRNPESWHDPEKFEPERFERVDVNYNGNYFEFIPFGAGRRICPGIAFGMAGVEIILARLLYHFDWDFPDGIGPEEFDMSENFGASAGRKNNLCLIAKYVQ
ncbi:hypothetical protein CASFOL_007339 [Castilleja foliolosa]|uniref:Cytochrome P450 n=1 Tax=Castilleja foliolosa TaxID=1961234 RepID=A0ABD3ECS7_9LAMI